MPILNSEKRDACKSLLGFSMTISSIPALYPIPEPAHRLIIDKRKNLVSCAKKKAVHWNFKFRLMLSYESILALFQTFLLEHACSDLSSTVGKLWSGQKEIILTSVTFNLNILENKGCGLNMRSCVTIINCT